MYVYTIYIRPLSVQAQYSRSCPIISCSCYIGSLTEVSQRQSQSYVTTDGQSASLSWNKAPIWGLRPDFHYCQTIAGLLIWGALSDERKDLSFTMYNIQYIYIYMLLPECIYSIYTVSVSPGSVQRIMSYL
jgi:hypothetical protein